MNHVDLARAVPFHRLVSVEFRKLFDTLSAMIITAILIMVTVAAIVGRGFLVGPRLETLIGTAGIGFGTLLPVLGILSVTSEWSHRTALTTFALEPRRGRVLAAKCLPPLVTAVGASVFAVLVAVAATAVFSNLDGNADWAMEPVAMAGQALSNVLIVAMALSIGMLTLNAPAAIVICLSTPMLWSVVARLGDTGAALAKWLDLNTTIAPLTAGDLAGGDVVRLAVSIVCWIVVPMALGVVRVVRKEAR